ncbi:hypothetical protein CPB85DRAFT_1227411 [Mucidula mucida]|nr:hypothetical protein CPB85DRAFT_1227411 [Mucidula mucida]
MHLIWENLMKNLTLLWTGEFKGVDEGDGCYELSAAIWEGIGKATAASGDTIPSCYGCRVPNVSTDRSYMSAEMWSFWTLYIGPVLLRNRFRHARYYKHFVELVYLLTICLQFQISASEIEQVRTGFIKWVTDYESLYYQRDPTRVNVCPVTVHALLHIAGSIKAMGPVWCYWAFPMERYCGTLSPAIRSRRNPWRSMDRFVLETAQLTQIKVVYDMHVGLALGRKARVHNSVRGSVHIPGYTSCILLPPRSKVRPDLLLIQKLLSAALVTRFNVSIQVIHAHIGEVFIEEYGCLRRTDTSEGDTMYANSMYKRAEDHRDPTFVRYTMQVDLNARRRGAAIRLVDREFYGQLQHIMHLHLPSHVRTAFKTELKDLIMVAVRNAPVKQVSGMEPLDIHVAQRMEGALDVVDAISVQCLIGRVVDGRECAFIDRSGSLVRCMPS